MLLKRSHLKERHQDLKNRFLSSLFGPMRISKSKYTFSLFAKEIVVHMNKHKHIEQMLLRCYIYVKSLIWL